MTGARVMASGAGLLAILAVVLPVVLPVVLWGGCASHTTYRHATPLGKGKTQVNVAPQINSAGPADGQAAPYPELAIMVKRGMSERLDLAGTATVLTLGRAYNAFGLEGMGQYHLYRSPGGRVDIAAALGLGYRLASTTGAVFEAIHASVPVIFGINFGKNQLVFSTFVSWQQWYSEGTAPVAIPASGISIGYYWQVTRGFALHPEMSFARSAVRLNDRGESVLGHIGLAMVWGGR